QRVRPRASASLSTVPRLRPRSALRNLWTASTETPARFAVAYAVRPRSRMTSRRDWLTGSLRADFVFAWLTGRSLRPGTALSHTDRQCLCQTAYPPGGGFRRLCHSRVDEEGCSHRPDSRHQCRRGWGLSGVREAANTRRVVVG